MGIIMSRGFRDRAARLVLFDTFVKTSLLYGAAVWGSHLLPRSCSVVPDYTGKLGLFYRRSLRTLLGVSNLRNEVVYVLSGRFPLQLYIAKYLWRYRRSLEESPRLAGVVARWVWRLDSSFVANRLSLHRLEVLHSSHPDLRSMYVAV